MLKAQAAAKAQGSNEQPFNSGCLGREPSAASLESTRVRQPTRLNMYPIFLKLQGRRVVMVGGGKVAAGKLAGLLAAGAQVTVVAADIRPELEQPGVQLVRRAFEDADLDGAWYAVAAATSEVNRQVAAAAERRRVFVNAVDDPAHATAYLGGVVRRGCMTIAISTGGRAPALAGLLREALDAWLPGDLDEWMRAADGARQAWRAHDVPMEERRPQLLETLNRLYDLKANSR
jgi:siroheme synthase-like protein